MQYRNRAASLAVGFAALLVVAAGGVEAGAQTGTEGAPTNLEVMESLSGEVVSDLLASVDGDISGRTVRLKPLASTPEYAFLSNVFTTALSRRGVRTVVGTGEGDGVLELQYQALQFGLVYPSVYRSWLIGGKNVRRRADITLVATLVDASDGSVVEVAESGRAAEDEFPHSEIRRVEQGTFDFTRPEMPSSGWTRVAEPVFVSGIVVGLIYLFFSNQSDES